MKLIKLSEEHYIVVDDSEIKEGDWVVSGTKTIVQCMYPENVHHRDVKKITHSTQPESLGMGWMQSVQPLFLSEVKELIGVVDVEKRVTSFFPLDCKDLSMYKFGIDMYNQALEDNKEKKYTEEDLADAINMARNEPDMSGNAIIQSLQPKTEWNVEIVDGILKLKK